MARRHHQYDTIRQSDISLLFFRPVGREDPPSSHRWIFPVVATKDGKDNLTGMSTNHTPSENCGVMSSRDYVQKNTTNSTGMFGPFCRSLKRKSVQPENPQWTSTSEHVGLASRVITAVSPSHIVTMMSHMSVLFAVAMGSNRPCLNGDGLYFEFSRSPFIVSSQHRRKEIVFSESF